MQYQEILERNLPYREGLPIENLLEESRPSVIEKSEVDFSTKV